MPASKLSRRRQQSATLRMPTGNGLLHQADLGQRLANVKYSSRIGAGFDQLTCDLLGRSGRGNCLPGEADEVLNTWRFGLLDFSLAGLRSWQGRLANIAYETVYDRRLRLETVKLELTFEGLVNVLDDYYAVAPGDTSHEESRVSTSDLVIGLLDDAPAPLVATFQNVEPSGVNVGQLNVSPQDTPLTLINNALTTGSANAIPVWFGIYFVDEGPWLQYLARTYEDWRLSLVNSGLKVAWVGDQYYSSVRVIRSDVAGASTVSDPVNNLTGLALHNGVIRQRTLSLRSVSEEGAQAAGDTALADHSNPLAIQGSATLKAEGDALWPEIETREGRRVPATRVRAGDFVRLYDARRFDPEAGDLGGQDRIVAVEKAEVDVEAGSVTLTFDQHRVRYRLHEDRHRILALQRALEPSSSQNTVYEQYDETATRFTVPDQDFALNPPAGRLDFVLHRVTNLRVKIAGRLVDNGSSTAKNTFKFGCLIDSDNTAAWGNAVGAVSKRFTQEPGLNNGSHDYTAVFRFTSIQPGPHFVQLFGNVTDGNGYAIDNIHVELRG